MLWYSGQRVDLKLQGEFLFLENLQRGGIQDDSIKAGKTSCCLLLQSPLLISFMAPEHLLLPSVIACWMQNWHRS